ncbi:hypothetical protein [Agrococcus sp. Marseille-Q4369]|uniref:hypothetical protein n=1 Tax=Agrococcus sp. Marseille-Q4369 TaxID=2810513 RepID=UPI001B8C0BBB|nr:hypothetical protein [Agrococcus sp. Marseille-Q4369]QUW18005.1 hypothetical protein JSQ78_09080 [Agrococcus sp. Marseille-Q4369]
MHPLIVLGIGLMVVSCVISGIDSVRTMRQGREPERRIRSFMLAAGMLVLGGILVASGAALS